MTKLKIGVLGNRSYLIHQTLSQNKEFYTKYDTPIFLKNHKEITKELDIVFSLGYYKLIDKKHLNKPKFGVFVLHATDLPKGRGWAPVNWALINKDDKIHITSFKADDGCDTGHYYMKSECPLVITDTYSSAYLKVEIEIVKHMRSILNDILSCGGVILHPQTGTPTWNRRRTPEDSELDINKSLKDLWPLIRACDNDDYPAFFILNGKKIYLRYEVSE